MQKVEAQNRLLILLFIALAMGAIYLLNSILLPFLIAAFLAYLVNPLVNKLIAHQLSRPLSVAIVSFILFFIIILILLLLIPYIQKQVNIFIEKSPEMLASLQYFLKRITIKLHLDADELDANALKGLVLEHWAKANSLIDWLLRSLVHSGMQIFTVIINLILIPVVTLYLLADWPTFTRNFKHALPERIRPTVLKLFNESDEVLSAFLRGQLLVMLTLSTLYSIGLTLIGLQTGLLIGITAGLLSFVPYLGVFVGIVVASLAAFLQTHELMSVLMVIIVFSVVQTLDQIFVTPKLVGNRIGLHPVVVIFAILAGGKLFGFLGVLLALPVAALTLVWARYFFKYPLIQP